ncbi:MAG TPA: hypothetical protein VF359_09020 [Anaerolineales bacterium]
MEFFLTDPNIERTLPADTRLINLRAEPYSEGRRLKVNLDLTPFQQKPYLDLALTDFSGELIAATSIVEPITCGIELNLHIRKFGEAQGGPYKLTALISYPDLGEVDRRDLYIKFPSPIE